MTDGKTYTVTFTAQDEAKTQSSAKFTATDGTIADFALSTTSITANKATTIKYSALDAKNVVIYEKEITDKPSGIDIDVTCDNGYQDGSKLVLINAGNTAKVVVTYHTYKYDTEGNETGVIKKEFTVTAVDANATVSNFVYTIVKAGNTPAWENLTANTKLAMGDDDRAAVFQIKDSNGENVTSTCGYTVESSNNNILLVSAANGVNGEAQLKPVAEGTAYLILKDGSKTVATLPVTVVAKRVIASFTLDKSSVSVATSAGADAPGATFIGYTAKDQYGDDIDVNLNDPDCKTKPSSTAVKPHVAINTTDKKITIDTQDGDNVVDATKGSYTYTVTATDGSNKSQTKSFTVNVVSPSTTTSADYVLQFVEGTDSDGTKAIASMDTTVNKDTTAKTISVNIAKRQNGVIVGGLDLNTVTISSIKVVGSNGTTYVNAKDISKATSSSAIDAEQVTAVFGDGAKDTSGKLFEISAVAIDTTTLAGNSLAVKNLPAGSYTVYVEFKVGNSTVNRTAVNSFKITDSQPALTASVLATSIDATTLDAVIENKDFVKFVYGGVTQIENDASTVKFIKADNSSKLGTNYVVKNVVVGVKVGTNKYVQMTAPINRVFTSKNGNWS